MDIAISVRGAVAIFGAMALLCVVETFLPLVRRRDLRRRHLPANIALATTTLTLNLAMNAGSVLFVAWVAPKGPVLLAGAGLAPWAIALVGFVVLDASTYACHRSMHALPAMWLVHRVHHCDPLVDATTSLRQHPLEGLWRFLFLVVPAAALGLPPEAVAAYRVVSALVGLAEHTNVGVRASIDAALRVLVCTPNMHKIHHSRRPAETDSNYGNIFSIFDRMFATFRQPEAGRIVDYGLDGFDDRGAQVLRGLLALPWRGAGPAAAASTADLESGMPLLTIAGERPMAARPASRMPVRS